MERAELTWLALMPGYAGRCVHHRRLARQLPGPRPCRIRHDDPQPAQVEPGDFTAALGYLPDRAVSVTLPAPAGNIQVIGAYVPSRDAGLEKTEASGNG
jgi:hypothetical protein